jgi:hypothetical protein
MNTTSLSILAALTLLAACPSTSPGQSREGSGTAAPRPIRPGAPVDYKDLAFSPEKWAARNLETRMIPWEGRAVVFLTTRPDFDRGVMTRFVGRLDAGWRLYAGLIGQSPTPFRQLGGKPTIAAVPRGDLTCGHGCGYLGATGIEVAGFYDKDFETVSRDPDAFPHYYFYEMGRNYYVFGDRHSQFTTGYAVFLRYVCMDALKCHDPDGDTRRAIDEAEGRFAGTGLTFLQGFTMQGGLDEKAPRLKGVAGPSDQPVLYASSMLRLRRELGGDAWVRRFFRALARCPEVKPDTPDGALRQGFLWLVAASSASGRDLSEVFVDRWRLPLGKATRQSLAKVPWKDADPSEVVDSVPLSFER